MSEAPTLEPALEDDYISPRAGGPALAAQRAPAVRPLAEQTLAPTRPNTRDAVFRRLLAVADIGAAAGGVTALGLITGRGVSAVALATAPLIVPLGKAGGRYDRDDLVLRKSTLDEIPGLMTLAGAYVFAWSLVAFATGLHLERGGGTAVVLWASVAVLLVALRALARLAGQSWAPRERILIVGGAAARKTLAHCIASDPGAHAEVIGFLPLEDERRTSHEWAGRSRRRRVLSFDDLAHIVEEQGIDRVLLIPTSADSELMLDAVRQTTRLGVKVSIVPRLFEVVGSAVEFDSVGGITVLGVRRAGLSRSSLAVKRTMDLFGAGLGLLVLAPLGLLIAAAIKLDSQGPVFFRQRRVGRDGRVFSMLKFRSMVDGADSQRAALLERNETVGVFKLSHDPRVTRMGAWLRRHSLDELPQLINVLRGEMSLVGPRPLVLDEDRLIEGPHRARRQFAPGMTGPWQVLGPRRPPLSEMVKTDYLYAANWSLWTDVKIVLRTFGHVARRRGV